VCTDVIRRDSADEGKVDTEGRKTKLKPSSLEKERVVFVGFVNSYIII